VRSLPQLRAQTACGRLSSMRCHDTCRDKRCHDTCRDKRCHDTCRDKRRHDTCRDKREPPGLPSLPDAGRQASCAGEGVDYPPAGPIAIAPRRSAGRPDSRAAAAREYFRVMSTGAVTNTRLRFKPGRSTGADCSPLQCRRPHCQHITLTSHTPSGLSPPPCRRRHCAARWRRGHSHDRDASRSRPTSALSRC
jgi:hypothetical protein